jgi:hypothetical protein
MSLTHTLTQLLKNPGTALADGGSSTTGGVMRRAAVEAVGSVLECSGPSTSGLTSGGGGCGGGLVTISTTGLPAKKRRGPVECCWNVRQCPNCPRRAN